MSEENKAAGGSSSHASCHVHRYEDDEDITVTMDCRLEQKGRFPGSLLCDVPAKFIVDVTVSGQLAEHLCFEECVDVHIECYGQNDPKPLGAQRKNYDCNYVDTPITYVFDIPAGWLPCGDEPDDKDDCGAVCCFAATLQTFTKCGTPGHISCVCKGPCVGVHKSPAHKTEAEG